jgi:hypothetical protein
VSGSGERRHGGVGINAVGVEMCGPYYPYLARGQMMLSTVLVVHTKYQSYHITSYYITSYHVKQCNNGNEYGEMIIPETQYDHQCSTTTDTMIDRASIQ